MQYYRLKTNIAINFCCFLLHYGYKSIYLLYKLIKFKLYEKLLFSINNFVNVVFCA